MTAGIIGRPLKLADPKVRNEIIEALLGGNSMIASAEAAGVARGTFFRWMAQGEQDEQLDRESLFREFRDSVMRTRGMAEKKALGFVWAAIEKRPDLALEWLRRQRGESWREVIDVLSGSEGAAYGDIDGLTAEERDREIAGYVRLAIRRRAAARTAAPAGERTRRGKREPVGSG